MKKDDQREVYADVLKRLIKHLQKRTDVQNIDLDVQIKYLEGQIIDSEVQINDFDVQIHDLDAQIMIWMSKS